MHSFKSLHAKTHVVPKHRYHNDDGGFASLNIMNDLEIELYCGLKPRTGQVTLNKLKVRRSLNYPSTHVLDSLPQYLHVDKYLG